jgi:hypothetical protein
MARCWHESPLGASSKLPSMYTPVVGRWSLHDGVDIVARAHASLSEGDGRPAWKTPA